MKYAGFSLLLAVRDGYLADGIPELNVKKKKKKKKKKKDFVTENSLIQVVPGKIIY